MESEEREFEILKRMIEITDELRQCESELREQLSLDCVYAGTTEGEWNNLEYLEWMLSGSGKEIEPEQENPCMKVAELLQNAISSTEKHEIELRSCWQMMRDNHVYWCISGMCAVPDGWLPAVGSARL